MTATNNKLQVNYTPRSLQTRQQHYLGIIYPEPIAL